MIFSAISTKLSETTSTSPNTSGTGSISQTEHQAALNLIGETVSFLKHFIGARHRLEVTHPFAFAPDASHMWAAANHVCSAPLNWFNTN